MSRFGPVLTFPALMSGTSLRIRPLKCSNTSLMFGHASWSQIDCLSKILLYSGPLSGQMGAYNPFGLDLLGLSLLP